MEKILDFFSSKMEEPPLYGWFHVLCWFVVISLCVIVVVFRNKISNTFVNKLLLILGIVFIVLEILKIVTMTYSNNRFTKILWYIFPFQFCSTPMYVFTIAGCLKRGRVYNCLISYLATYCLFAGLCVMLVPATVFTTLIGLNIHTMIVHGGMIVIGVMLLSTQTAELKWRTLLKGSSVFLIVCSIALILNILWHFFGTNANFNMFFISPWGECDFPILGFIQDNAPYIVFLLSYIIVFTFCGGAILGFSMLIKKLNKTKSKH